MQIRTRRVAADGDCKRQGRLPLPSGILDAWDGKEGQQVPSFPLSLLLCSTTESPDHGGERSESSLPPNRPGMGLAAALRSCVRGWRGLGCAVGWCKKEKKKKRKLKKGLRATARLGDPKGP